MIDFTIIFQLKGLKPKNNDQTNFYECCDLTKKVYIVEAVWRREEEEEAEMMTTSSECNEVFPLVRDFLKR